MPNQKGEYLIAGAEPDLEERITKIVDQWLDDAAIDERNGHTEGAQAIRACAIEINRALIANSQNTQLFRQAQTACLRIAALN